MYMTCFPYGFPTGYAPASRGSSRIWPRCTNAEPGSYSTATNVVNQRASSARERMNTQTWLATALKGEDPDA